MRTPVPTEIAATYEHEKRLPSRARVCMHVLGVARTDVRVLREAATLAAAGWPTTIVDMEDDASRPHAETIQDIQIRHIRMPSWFTPTRFKPWFLVKATSALLRGVAALLRAPADVYHAHDITALPACYLAARLRRKPLVFDAHELPLVEPNITRWRRLSGVAHAVLRSMMRRCDRVITVSPPIADELRRRYGGPPATLLRNIPAYQAPQPSDRLREHLGLDRGTRIALYQGNLQPDRGLDGLIRAARFLEPGSVLVLMGRGALRTELEALIAREHVADRVKLLPPVPYADLLAWTASADLGLIIYPRGYSLNVQMCLPNKLFEYLMAGVPVLASPLEAVSALIARYDVGSIVPSLEPEALGAALSGALADASALDRMRRHALAAAAGDLCWEREGQNLIELYAGLVPMNHSTHHSRSRGSQRNRGR